MKPLAPTSGRSRAFREVDAASLRWTNRLDPRERPASPPIIGAVSIPLSELPGRTYELPPKEEAIEVVGEAALADAAVEWLVAHGRKAHSSGFYSFGERIEARRLWRPNEFLASVAGEGPGRALDLGCGTGRDAVYLASLGWEVAAIDRLADALERAEDLERRYRGEAGIRWLVREMNGWPPDLEGPYDLVTMFYFLDRAGLEAAADRLGPGGRLVLETFTPTHREAFGKPRSGQLVLTAEEAPGLLRRLEIEHCEEGWHGGRHTVRVVARRRRS